MKLLRLLYPRRLKTEYLLFFIILLTFGISGFKALKSSEVCFKNNCFNVELAIHPDEQRRGLMFRNNIDKDTGMLFIFDKDGEYSFWMKNVYVPLDIAWIDKHKEVVAIAKNAQPCKEEASCPSIKTNKSARYVLELNAGTVDNIGLALGDKLTFDVNQ